MDYSSWVDPSLDLNFKPLRVGGEDYPLLGRFPIAEQMEINFMEMGRKVSVKEETGALVEELNRVSAENKKLTEMLTVVCENYNALRSQLTAYTSKNRENEIEVCQSKKRKAESCSNHNIEMNGNSESSSTDEEPCKKPREEIIQAKTSRVYVRTEASDQSLLVKDGYQWRKYGQKVTRDNPCPRAYFRCAAAPSCPVKKKVQRSVEDQSVVVATYEGEHNHPCPSQNEPTIGSSHSLALGSSSLACSGPTINLDPAKSKSKNDAKCSLSRLDVPEVRQFLVEQMASSLTKDPNFTAALTAAMSGKVFHHNDAGKW